MIRQNQRLLNAILVLSDVLVIVFSLLCAAYVRFYTTIFGPIGGHLGYEEYALFLLLAILPVYLILYFSFGLYKPFRTHRSIFSEASQIIKVNITAFFVLETILFIIDQPDFSRILMFLLPIFASIFGIFERSVVRGFLMELRENDKNLKHILIVGDNELAFNFERKITQNKYLGYKIYGFLGRPERVGKLVDGVPIVGSFGDLDKILHDHSFDRVILAIPLKYYKHINKLVDSCENAGIKAEIIPAYTQYFPARPSVDMIEDIPIINIRYVPLDDAFNKTVKKISDLVVATIAIIITSPIMIVVAILIKLTSPGPIIFKQERVGYQQKHFMMYKFRSMKVQNPSEEKSEWTTPDDPRKTKIGEFIRKTSIDELPQFFNVLKGDMSVVGPRPERPFFVEQFRKDIPKYMVKHQVRPGLTGWAQIHGCRGNTSIKKRIEYDIEYVENWHFGLDVAIMIKTILKSNTNAY
ncbi:MAG: undecaprenyl-phosphate glucose phosphotransferase [Methanobrevibacter boviskoreani]|jgi:Undecaprenyl-phosphate glucose phosphotransferase|uniref:undecaprenyl-phosphate glucose phosphotransferase n=1 Tax=Methanobrevibacter TaxID=2172 RepID=UPI0003348D69|nr:MULTISPECIES: undecaprenyl-phosphate glucose phosphotransferase [Methanobrevibacter]AGN17551.1 exopolysaccharide biosynthesis polyprenyl glycosylphosphotransferase [Methanobrevibacter sp. AbM4]MCI6775585.1 undecaprenyl-phosphate glucose phosphotransferase [Methanobrevibacter boviskoreani]MCI6930499.1 undecaprenyl-phosphate glucose phosphotransferase [Methanobrevibacter boviskoreani]MDD6257023.1 undecaprenyl-phosphate glucose phosphotransferase [Methanobrevibacter boviskoreani]MDY5614868.1 u